MKIKKVYYNDADEGIVPKQTEIDFITLFVLPGSGSGTTNVPAIKICKEIHSSEKFMS